jgi:hypothetical protein
MRKLNGSKKRKLAAKRGRQQKCSDPMGLALLCQNSGLQSASGATG